MSSSYMGDKKPDEPGYPLPSRFDSPNPVYGSYTVPPKPYQPYQSDVGYQQYPSYPVPEQPIYQPYRPPGSPSADQSSVNPYRYHSKGTGGHVDREEQPSSYVPPQDHYVPLHSPPQQDSGLYPSETNAQQSPYGFDAENGRRRRKGPKQPRPAVKEPLTFELNPLEPQDVTIHMSLDATDDVEDVLEEFSRLRRLGRFNDAARHFDAHLEHFLDNKYVLTQYGRFLAERVNSSEFAKLAKRFPPQEAAVDDALELNWDLLVYLMGLDSDVETPVLQDVDKLGDKALDHLQESFPNLDSTEMELLHLVLICSAASLDDFQERFSPYTFADLYSHLWRQGMVWELCSLFLALEPICGVETVLRMFFPYFMDSPLSSSDEGGVRRLVEDWDSPDEASAFALVDLFTSLALAYMKLPRKRKIIDLCLDHASKYASALISTDTHNLKSRPCLRYTMAGVLLESYDDDEGDQRPIPLSLDSGVAGSIFTTRYLFPRASLPLYAPLEDEKPLWLPRKTKTSRTARLTTKAVMKAAEDLGDVEMQEACLLEAMEQGEEAPELVVEKLDALQATLGSGLARQSTLLFRYMLKQTPASLEELRRDILAQGETGRRSTWQDYSQCLIVRALTSGKRAKEAYQKKADAIEELLDPRERERQTYRVQSGVYPVEAYRAPPERPVQQQQQPQPQLQPQPQPLQQPQPYPAPPGPVYFNLTVVNPPVELDSSEQARYKLAPRGAGSSDKQGVNRRKKEVTWKADAKLATKLGPGDDDVIGATMSVVPDLPLYTPSTLYD
ncbi:hypothetical protein VFPFJ_01444 [Purpureocillium lilacinum]|uniref:Uncharacterized protein n=1 Tax=Purpureocillium lilacinum TaxID=33203 RepID=A0A179HZ83_PURLI|nr:hypothetical protein VFPFJ_01444 [Purpureocillium lilacinum]OAQ95334.1 hypothetical protein VFPFJ_01444 [Purpureocillium lilacinum]GJN66454.1 hypothetical protein PLICBS_000472 [Purpureocillium lilacinum]